MSSQLSSSFRQAPLTRLGKTAYWLAAVWGMVIIVNSFLANSLKDSGLLPVLTILAYGFGLAAGIAGLVAFIRFRERSWQVILSLVVGLLVGLLLIVNLALPG